MDFKGLEAELDAYPKKYPHLNGDIMDYRTLNR